MWIFKDVVTAAGLVIMALIFVTGAIGLGFNVQGIRNTAILWGLNLFELISCIFTFSFFVVVFRLIKRLNQYEKDSLSLWIRRMGLQLVEDPQKQQYPYHIAWYFDVNISNRSKIQFLGIRSILLKIKYSEKTILLRPFLGIPKGELPNLPNGEIESSFTLGPAESKSGVLLFVEEIKNTEDKEKLKYGNPFKDNLVLIDNMEKEHIYTVNPQMFTWR
jgi:hypothetical protein